jgi:hypothetical protein
MLTACFQHALRLFQESLKPESEHASFFACDVGLKEKKIQKNKKGFFFNLER